MEQGLFGLGGSEFFLIALFALLLFGPDKIPQMARTVGKFMREFNKYKDMMESTVRAEVYKAEWQSEPAEGKPAAEAPPEEPQPPAAPASASWAADEDDEEEEE